MHWKSWRQASKSFSVDEIVAERISGSDLTSRATGVIDEAHRSHPEKSGIELEHLRDFPEPTDAIFEALVSDLTRGDFVRKGNLIARRSHKASLSGETEELANKILKALAAKPFDPPAVKQMRH